MNVSDWKRAVRKAMRHSRNIFQVNWHLGFTAFGGPPVHFKIFHDEFVVKLNWIDEQLYQELFSISQALSGPASTKMLYCINLIHDSLLGAVLSFLIWSLPGALGMFGLSVGVSNIGDSLPRAAYAVLSGLNAATVGIIALAAVELSAKAVTDNLTRILVFLTAAAGMLYNALWYFPVLIFASGCVTVVYDYRCLHRPIRALVNKLTSMRRVMITENSRTVQVSEDQSVRAGSTIFVPGNTVEAEMRPHSETNASGVALDDQVSYPASDFEPRIIPEEYRLNFSWKAGTAIIASFFVLFTVVMILRGTLLDPPLLYKLFANLYLAGTIIFGGGPVVIPLLREYVVAEGWVSPRDFLVGLAIAQAFPGPNFNFAVFLGGLTAINGGFSSIVGAIIAFCGIFSPGIVLVHGTLGIWGTLRNRRWVKAGVRGVNAGAVGLIYTAVYRIWRVGYIDQGFESGKSLGDDPWWVIVTASAYIGGRYFGIVAPLAILLGAVLGLIRYGVVVGRD